MEYVPHAKNALHATYPVAAAPTADAVLANGLIAFIARFTDFP